MQSRGVSGVEARFGSALATSLPCPLPRQSVCYGLVMRFAWLLVVVLACKSEDKRPRTAIETKEQAVEAARKAADEATRSMHEAEDRAADAWRRLEAVKAEQVKAVEESADAKERLAAVRKEAAETIELADEKLAELAKALANVGMKTERATKDLEAATTDDARAKARAALDKLQAQKAELETTIAKIKQLKDELATSSSQ